MSVFDDEPIMAGAKMRVVAVNTDVLDMKPESFDIDNGTLTDAGAVGTAHRITNATNVFVPMHRICCVWLLKEWPV